MRNLKKLLSVVLVVAMIAGLCAVGSFSAAAAEYSETTNYKEAAAVVTGIGIINGYEDGTMQYDKAVTREEAAKIICIALVGAATADNLKTATAPFADVAANRWSAPFINYLKAQGIVNGKTATQFDPTAEVTAVEFAKMMLCATGFGKANEFVGASWDVNTIAKANEFGVFEGTLATDLTAAATREQCMLYTFNSITRVPVVNYNSTFQTYYTGNSVMNGAADKVPDTYVGVANYTVGTTTYTTNYRYTLGYSKFKLVKTAGVGADAYGRPASVWRIDGGKQITDAVATTTPAAVIKGSISSMTLAQNLDANVISNINKYLTSTGKYIYEADVAATTTTPAISADARIFYYVDGVRTGTFMSYIKGNEMLANMLASAGAITEIYVDSDDNGDYCLTFVVINQYFAKVTKVDAAAKKLYLTVFDSNTTGNAANLTNCVVDGEKVNISGFAKDDYVLVNLENNGIALANGSNVTSIVKANTAVATYTGTDSFGWYIVDGQHLQATSKLSSSIIKMNAGQKALDLTIGNTYTFYYDTLGNIAFFELYDEAETGTANYLFVPEDTSINGVKASVSDDDWNEGIKAYAKIGAIFPAGGQKDLYLPVKTENNKNYVVITDGSTVNKYYLGDTTSAPTATPKGVKAFYQDVKGKFFSYTTNEDGTINLKTLNNRVASQAAVAAGGGNINKGLATVPGVNGYTANSKTVLTVINTSGEAKTYTGIANFPTTAISGSAPVFYTYANNSKTIKTLCYVDNAAAVRDLNLAYCVSKVGEDANGITYKFYVDGEEKDVVFDDTHPALSTGRIYNLVLSNSGNTATVMNYSAGTQYLVNGDYSNTFVGNDSPLNATATDLKTLGKYNFASLGFENYYAWATIKTVDTNTFSTEGVAAPATAGRAFDATEYGAQVLDVNGNDITNAGVSSHTYYYDGNTKIYDCRAKGAKGELSEGAIFMAFVDTNNGGTYNGVAYCTYIWIVG